MSERVPNPKFVKSGRWLCPMCDGEFDSDVAVLAHRPDCPNHPETGSNPMNLPTMQMPAEEARERLKQYRDQLKRRVDEEYKAVAAGLTEMSNGRPVVDVYEALREGGISEDGLPNIALARADREQVRYVPPGWNSGTWSNGRHAGRTRFGFDGRKDTSFPLDQTNLWRTWPLPAEWRDEMNGANHYAIVPMIPPAAREAMSGQAREHWILWEVEEWKRGREQVEADRDPFLLKPLGGDLFSIVHQWDLTDLERAVMRASRQES